MNKRKVSCLECRVKKTKCDGQSPCGRCASKGISNCVYSKLRAPGRPFKNATITKLSLSSVDKASFCKEFILENVNEIKRNQSEQKQIQQKRKEEEEEEEQSMAGIIDQSFKTLFKHYEGSLAIDSQLKKEIDSIPDRVYLSGLNHLFMSTACHISSVIIRRLSSLRLSYYSQTGFLTYALNKDRSLRFFTTPSPNALVSNPLLSLPPNEAVHLIDAFFELDPYSLILNKTIILQKYWSDTADPLIMSVIYGSALAKLPLRENQSLELWDSWEKKGNNPFLEYAYILLFSKDTQMTPDVYIATCLLALFEGCFGYPKRALALFSVIIMMGARLRLSDKGYFASIDPLQRESLIMSFWMTYKASVTGCFELENAAAYLYSKIKIPLPPVNAQNSASYHYDLLNNNMVSPQERSYLVESFYLECVIAEINQRILVYTSTKQKTPGYSKGEDILKIIDEVKHDISSARSSWSKLQEFTIDSLILYYTICLSFFREDCYNFYLQRSETPSKLDLTKPDAVYLVNRNLPYATQLVDKIMDFLGKPEICYNDYSYAPMSLIGSQLDSASQILMYSAILDPRNLILRDYLELIVMILDNTQHWAKWDMATAIKEPISKFLKEFYYSPSSQETITPLTFDFNWLQDDLLWNSSVVPFYSYTDNVDIDSLFDGII